MTTLIKTFWLKSIRSHNGYGTPKVLSTAMSLASVVTRVFGALCKLMILAAVWYVPGPLLHRILSTCLAARIVAAW